MAQVCENAFCRESNEIFNIIFYTIFQVDITGYGLDKTTKLFFRLNVGSLVDNLTFDFGSLSRIQEMELNITVGIFTLQIDS